MSRYWQRQEFHALGGAGLFSKVDFYDNYPSPAVVPSRTAFQGHFIVLDIKHAPLGIFTYIQVGLTCGSSASRPHCTRPLPSPS